MPSTPISPSPAPRRTRRPGPVDEPRISAWARRAVETTLEARAAAYRRTEFLLGFPRLSAETIAAETEEAAQAVLREIASALRRERARAGHWTYDLDRHIALLVAHRAEQARAERIRAATQRGRKGR